MPPSEISDKGLAAFILGLFRGLTMHDSFPVKVRGVIDNFDTDQYIESFTLVTDSGLRYRVTVMLDE